jgi:Trypsin-like peptidase domain
MPVSPQRLEELRELLKDCSAELVAENGARGSGFFVDECHVLTCAHVVKGKDAQVKVKPYEREERGGTVVEFEGGVDVDLALVKVDRLPGEPPRPAVVLDDHLDDNVTYYAVGWPKGDILGAEGIEELRYNGHKKGDSLLILDAGQANVTEGLSGGAVLSSVTGAVVALVQYSKERDNNLGGGAIPVARAAECFDRIRSVVEKPPLVTRRWKAGLGLDGWNALKKPAGWHTAIDITVEGDRKSWSVRTDDGQAVPVPNLPGRVSDALFYWAQRRQIQAKDDVKLLGQLLAGAVFPAEVAAQLAGNQDADDLRVRLRVADEDLFDVPWEFVTLDSENDVHVAAAQNLRFVRVESHPDSEQVDLLPREQGDAGVLALAVQPETWQERMKKFGRLMETRWPGPGAIAKQLRTAADPAKHLTLEVMENPRPAGVQQKLEETRPEVVHYVGFGRCEGEAQLAFTDADGDVAWKSAAEVFDWVAKSGARVLVVQFLPPPLGERSEPVASRSFKGALAKRVNAVVLTRFPMLLGHLNSFNKVFYTELGEGRSIETAVQRARCDVHVNEYDNDAGAFGSFTLITGELAGMQLVRSDVQAPYAGGAKQSDRQGAEQPVPAPGEASQDAFVR